MSQNSNALKNNVVKVVLLCLLLLGWGIIQSQMSANNTAAEISVVENSVIEQLPVLEKFISNHLAVPDIPLESKIQLAEVLQEVALPQLLPAPAKANPIQQQPASSQLLKKQQAAIEAGMPQATEEEKKIWLETLRDLPPEAIRDMLRTRNSVGPMMKSLKTDIPKISLPKILQPTEDTKQFTTPSSEKSVTSRSQQTLQTGIVALQQIEQVLINNIVNASTMGFKRTSVSLTDLPYDTIEIPAPFMEVGKANNSVENIHLPVGFGVLMSKAEVDLSQGKLKKTGRSLDVAIKGDGFFQVTSDDGQILYTRNGQFSLDADRNFIFQTVGKVFDLEPLITLPSDWIDVKISSTGIVTVEQPDTSDETALGQLQLVKFPVPSRLKQLGGGLYAATKAAGEPMVASPRTGGFGRLQQGYLESSNVNIKSEVATLKQYRKQLQTLLELQRDLR